MSNIFTAVNMRKPRHNTFDLSHDRKMSMNMGQLVPIMNLECVPGDTINISTSQMVKFAPMLAPIMHKVFLYTHFFFVPNRILWDNWEDFITGGEDGTAEPEFPHFNQPLDTLDVGKLADYLGIPPNPSITRDVKFSALPFAAYGKIFNEYFRDQNLVDKVWEKATDGEQTSVEAGTLLTGRCLNRAWQHDYFTSCLPFTQKGPEATIPLGTEAPIEYKVPSPAYGSWLKNPADGSNWTGGGLPTAMFATTGSSGNTVLGDTAIPTNQVSLDVSKSHVADLSSATAAGIIDLRRAFKLQEWLEKNARGGSRYIESILSHFGVRSSDQRLQRPEFLGGSTQRVQFSEVLQTSGTNGEPTPQGNMAGHGVAVGGSKPIEYYCEEHGMIIGLMSVMPKTAYYQGLDKQWTKFDKFDYYWPSFAHIGEQAVIEEELFITNTPDNDQETFGYIPRYAEYKYKPSSVHGQFRSTLDFWHLARKFAVQPVLNEQFINCVPDTRIFAVEEQDSEHLYCHVYHDVKARRAMPYFGNPKI